MFTQFYIDAQTSQGCVSFVVPHVFVLGFGVISEVTRKQLSSGSCMATLVK